MWKIFLLTSVFASIALLGCKEKVQRPEEEPSEIVMLENPGSILFSSNRERNDIGLDLFVMNEDGSNVKKLTNSPFSYFNAKWAPGGTQIIARSDKNQIFENAPLYLLNLINGKISKLTDEGRGPVWSRDGKKIAFASCGGLCGKLDIYVLDIESGSEKNVSRTLDSNEIVYDWNLDGTSLLISSNDTTRNSEGDDELYFLNIENQSLIRLTDNEVIDSDARLSPDGSLIVFATSTGTDRDLFIMDTQGNNKRNLINDDYFFNASPSWAPDGTKIIFQASDETGQKDIFQLFTIHVDGTGLQQLTDGPYSYREPDWRRD